MVNRPDVVQASGLGGSGGLLGDGASIMEYPTTKNAFEKWIGISGIYRTPPVGDAAQGMTRVVAALPK